MTTFLIIGAVGLALVAATLLIGDVLDGVLGLDALDNDLFSLSSIAAFVGAFGFGGAISLALVPNTLLAVVVGGAIGSTASWGAVRLTRALRSGEDSSTFRSQSMIGHPARVITAIPETGFGEVQLAVGGHVRKFSATAGRPVEAGTEVWISAIVSPTAVEVTPTDDSPTAIP
ncbi:hypothetical protein [Tessaracoccus sp. G1721]